jgi:hypothetical protein
MLARSVPVILFVFAPGFPLDHVHLATGTQAALKVAQQLALEKGIVAVEKHQMGKIPGSDFFDGLSVADNQLCITFPHEAWYTPGSEINTIARTRRPNSVGPARATTPLFFVATLPPSIRPGYLALTLATIVFRRLMSPDPREPFHQMGAT